MKVKDVIICSVFSQAVPLPDIKGKVVLIIDLLFT